MVEAKPRYYRDIGQVHTILTDEAANEMLRGGWELLKAEVMDGKEGPITVYVVGKTLEQVYTKPITTIAPGGSTVGLDSSGAAGYGKGTCKYCQAAILWKDRKPHNQDLSAHRCQSNR